VITNKRTKKEIEMQDFYFDQNKSSNTILSKVDFSIKTINEFSVDKQWWILLQLLVLHLRLLIFSGLLNSSVSPLVGALESLRHEQLPEVLRGEFLHILAVVVNLPCWKVATCIHTPTQENTHHHTKICIHNVHTYKHKCTCICTDANRQRWEGKQQHSTTSN